MTRPTTAARISNSFGPRDVLAGSAAAAPARPRAADTTENGVRRPHPGLCRRLAAGLAAAVRLGGPLWFERRLVTPLDALMRNPVQTAGQGATS